jgi:DNA-binding NarL/FixJ family response regulator
VLCDDHRLLLTGLALALADLGHSIEAAVTTRAEAAQAVGRCEPDVLLTDLAFPDGSGLDLARWVQEQHPRVTVVTMTGSDDPEPLAEALEIGVRGYVRKTQRVERIADAVGRVLAGELVVDRELLSLLKNRKAGSRPQAGNPLDALTLRERNVLALLSAGASTSAIAADLGVSASTVKTHVQSIFVKLQVHSRLQAVAVLDRAGALPGWTDDLAAAR